jgi:hypothetical protein
MRLRSLLTLSVALAATITIAGCTSDSSTAPQTPAPAAAPAAPSQSLLGGLLGGTTASQTITPLRRNTPLAKPITVTKNIGVLGGTIVVPGAGFTLVVPPLAVGKTMTFSVTALAGSNVAYEFGPHGTKFLLPLVATQNLAGTNAPALSVGLSLGYFPDSNNPTSVSELLGVQVDLLKLVGVSTISHFSGYIYAVGRGGE